MQPKLPSRKSFTDKKGQSSGSRLAPDNETTPTVAILNEEQRQLAMKRFAVLQPHLEDDVPLAQAARHAGVPIRTAERWLARYRKIGLVGLAHSVRSDAAAHRLTADLGTLIEGMGLKKPRSSAAAIHRRISDIAKGKGWRVPSYGHGLFNSCQPRSGADDAVA